ncbi:hypothetical protein MNB_SUP05-5-929 [hydrothermal vent metagenome]|uniref:DUF4395 domain-containing protein n=1 Tax=hydrothermal vent metagenome TaxID=652676 RepID=A0A1W1CD03_9ZZZZ
MNIFKKLWFRDVDESVIYINDVAMRIRAGIMLFIPIYLSFTLYDAIYGGSFIVDKNTLIDTYETNWDDMIIYTAELVKKTYEYSKQTYLLFYALFEMLAGMFVFTSRFSPLIILSTFLSRNITPVWKPLIPKRFAWSLGSSIIIICLIFFNPDTFASWINTIFQSEVLPTTQNYIPRWLPLSLVWVCIGFMWLESVLGFCAGCKIHSLLVYIGVIKEECEACNNLTFPSNKD